MISFNVPAVLGTEINYINEAIAQQKLCGDGYFSKKCQGWLEDNLKVKKALLTPSCTAALEMAALLIDIGPGDQVIMPSYTFVSTANAFALRGAEIVFVDINPETMNIDPVHIKSAITTKTKAIVIVHYAGVACDMDKIMELAEDNSLYLIEDAAQALMSFYKDRPLGSLGHLGCLSFHETKNYTSGGEGGALLINDDKFIDRAEILREKGTNRSEFLRGEIDKYTWRDLGSSFLPSELQAAYLYAQLRAALPIKLKRELIWNKYHDSFLSLENKGLVERPIVPSDASHNGHMYYLKLSNLSDRTDFMSQMQRLGVQTAFHYIPLHSSPAGLKYGVFKGRDSHTSNESQRLVRLPIWFNLEKEQMDYVVSSTIECVSKIS